MKKISKAEYFKHKKELQKLFSLGRKYDKEKDPEKKAALEKEIIKMSEGLKGKMHLQECTEEDKLKVVGGDLNSPSTELEENNETEEDSIPDNEDARQ